MRRSLDCCSAGEGLGAGRSSSMLEGSSWYPPVSVHTYATRTSGMDANVCVYARVCACMCACVCDV